MPTKFNVFTGTLDFVDQGGTQWLPPVQSEGDLPLTDPDGSARVVRDTDSVYVFDSGNSKWHKQSPEAGSFNGTSTANGISVSEVDSGDTTQFQISIHAADSSNPGAVTTGAQSFAGNKTFDNNVTVTGDLTVNGTTTTINTSTLDVTDANITVNNGGNQATADANDAGITVEMSDATDAIIGYDSTLTSKFHIGEVGSVAEIADVSSAQTITNKTVVAANNTITTAASGNLTATELNAALAELQTDIDGRANTALSNLTSPTSVNQALLPNGPQDIGSSSAEWRRLYLDRDAQTDEIFLQGSTRIGTGGTSPSGKTVLGAMRAVSTSGPQYLGMYSVDSSTVSQSHPITIETGGNTSSGSTGNIDIRTGTPNTGTRGDIILSAENLQIENYADFTLSDLAPTWATDIPSLEFDGTTTEATNAFATGIIHRGNDSQSQFVITTEEQTSGSNGSSDINIYTGPHSGTGSTGDVNIYSGEQTGSAGSTGQVQINSSASANGNSGQVELSSGIGSTASGQARITTGSAATSGGVSITTGTGTTASGNILLTTGGSAGTRGRIDLDARKIELDSDETIDLIQQQRITNVADPTSAQDAATKAYVDSVTSSAAGDIDPTTFALANNQAAAANVTGLAFANGVTRSFSAHVSVEIDADTDLFEVFEIKGIQRGADWVIAQSSTGDSSGVVFTITTAGQIQYTSDNYTGFVSGDIKFRAITLEV